MNFRDALGNAFVAAGEAFPRLCVVTADVSKSTRSVQFQAKWPDRFYTVGIAEANAVGIAAGIASFGRPVIFTAYSVFAAQKPFEQIRNSICYPNLDVKIVATHGGISTGEDGATHQAIEDIAIMRAIPNMKVLVAADPGEVQSALFAAIDQTGPVFLRLGRSVGAVLHESANNVDYVVGQAEVLHTGADLTIAAVGVMVEQALHAAVTLEEQGVAATVLNLRSVKPLDTDTLLRCAAATGAVVTAEDHNRHGGVYSAVCEALAGQCPVPVEYVAVEDTFGESGDGTSLMIKYGLTANAIVDKSLKALSRKQVAYRG